MNAGFMAHSRKDWWLVGLACLEAALVAYGTLGFGRVTLAESVALGAALVFLNCTNFQCIAHNFLHNPFFRSPALNHAFSIVNTLALGVPQTLYRFQHLHHHKYNNDAKDPRTGTTQDQTSTYRFSSSESEESILTYALIGPFRTDLGHFMRAAQRSGKLGLAPPLARHHGVPVDGRDDLNRWVQAVDRTIRPWQYSPKLDLRPWNRLLIFASNYLYSLHYADSAMAPRMFHGLGRFDRLRSGWISEAT